VSRWTTEDIPDQRGRTALVTGANSGLGWETAMALAEKGAKVILACRSRERGEDAARQILARAPQAQLEVEELDLADLDSVRAFAARASAHHTRLDLLVANAGVMATPGGRTRQGLELQLGTNHFGHFALVGLLLPLLLASPGSRVVVVSSSAHYFSPLGFGDVEKEHFGLGSWLAYFRSKQANLLFQLGLQRRLERAGASTIAVASHPGTTDSALQRYSWPARLFSTAIAMTPEQGALTTLRAATDPTVNGGDYFGPDGLGGLRGHPVLVGRSPAARNPQTAERLWALSESRTGVRYPLD
jgi:NAD(P)-dependent dehydrogenase (short-subunit alcohol dehydrogenase family)